GAVEVKDSARLGGIACLAGVPLRADGHFHQTISVDIPRGNADVVVRGQVLCHDKALPVSVPVPDDLFLISQQNVRFAVPVHIADSQSVTNGDLIVHYLGLEYRRGGIFRRWIAGFRSQKKIRNSGKKKVFHRDYFYISLRERIYKR